MSSTMACSFAAMSDSRSRISAAIAATICARLGPAGVNNRSLSLSATLSFNAATCACRSAACASFEAHATTGGMRPVPKGARNSPPADGTWATGPQRLPCSADTAASIVATLNTISRDCGGPVMRRNSILVFTLEWQSSLLLGGCDLTSACAHRVDSFLRTHHHTATP